MGFGGISAWQLIIILVIVLLIFGTKKLRSVGGDLGSAIKSFKKAIKEEPKSKKAGEDESASTKENGDDVDPDVVEPDTIKSVVTDTESDGKPAVSEKAV